MTKIFNSSHGVVLDWANTVCQLYQIRRFPEDNNFGLGNRPCNNSNCNRYIDFLLDIEELIEDPEMRKLIDDEWEKYFEQSRLALKEQHTVKSFQAENARSQQ